MACKGSLTSRHFRKWDFLSLPCRREEVAAGFQLDSLVSVIAISDDSAEAVALLCFVLELLSVANSHVVLFHPKSEFWDSDELRW